MRTPIHVRVNMRTGQRPTIKTAYTGQPVGELIIGNLVVSAGPKDDTGRLVRVFLTRQQAQELAAQLGVLLAD